MYRKVDIKNVLHGVMCQKTGLLILLDFILVQVVPHIILLNELMVNGI